MELKELEGLNISIECLSQTTANKLLLLMSNYFSDESWGIIQSKGKYVGIFTVYNEPKESQMFFACPYKIFDYLFLNKDEAKKFKIECYQSNR